jgi:hypothetical protein
MKPKDLYIPVLPTKRGKMIFDLEDEEYSTYFIDELLVSLNEGYQVERIFEVHQFEKSNDESNLK